MRERHVRCDGLVSRCLRGPIPDRIPAPTTCWPVFPSLFTSGAPEALWQTQKRLPHQRQGADGFTAEFLPTQRRYSHHSSFTQQLLEVKAWNPGCHQDPPLVSSASVHSFPADNFVFLVLAR